MSIHRHIVAIVLLIFATSCDIFDKKPRVFHANLVDWSVKDNKLTIVGEIKDKELLPESAQVYIVYTAVARDKGDFRSLKSQVPESGWYYDRISARSTFAQSVKQIVDDAGFFSISMEGLDFGTRYEFAIAISNADIEAEDKVFYTSVSTHTTDIVSVYGLEVEKEKGIVEEVEWEYTPESFDFAGRTDAYFKVEWQAQYSVYGDKRFDYPNANILEQKVNTNEITFPTFGKYALLSNTYYKIRIKVYMNDNEQDQTGWVTFLNGSRF